MELASYYYTVPIDLQRHNEKLRIVKQLKIKYVRQRDSLISEKENCTSWSRKEDTTEEQPQM